ncbi:MAG: polysaccharide pyruvyl transferase family protein [Planctomycetaceae bacterium]
MIPLHWVANGNFGDELSPLIVRHVTVREVRHIPGPVDEPHLFAVGSFCQIANDQTHIWGTGILHAHAALSSDPIYHMVRGPLTLQRVREAGGDCDCLGDPVSFVPELFPAGDEIGEWCFIPQWREVPLVPQIDGVTILSPLKPIAEFCRVLSGHRYVLSSSLHGLIAAHAFGLKAAWVKVSDRPLGDDVKYRDYLLAQGLDPEPLPFPGFDVRMFRGLAPRLRAAPPDLDVMRRACPAW